jgi:putative oxidoreductase
MDLFRGIARPLLASMFIYGGVDSVRHASKKTATAHSVVDPVTDVLGLPGDDLMWVRVNAAVQVAAGTALAVGKWPRVAALALAASLVPTTLAGHSFWNESDASSRASQRIQFLKNVSMLGGLLIAADDTGGRPSVPWRIHKAAEHAIEALPRPVPSLHAA